jgi:hypothetical protein
LDNPFPRATRRESERSSATVDALLQFNIKATPATPETIAPFTALADKNKLVFGELLDRALEAFERATVKS